MPVMDKMFLPYLKEKPLTNSDGHYHIHAVCNASKFSSTKFSEKGIRYEAGHVAYYLSPGKITKNQDAMLRELGKTEVNQGNVPHLLEIINKRIDCPYMDLNDFDRRDICRAVCKDFVKETEQSVDDGQLSYGMAEAGVNDPKTARTVAELFYKLNDRPETYGSSYNNFYPDALVKIAEKPLEDWMIPVVKQTVEKGLVRGDNLGRGSDLFAACKAWKICPVMPKAVAEQVGEMSLAKRMIAGAVTEKLAETQGKGLNYHKELIPEFWKEMSRAQEMPFAQSMKMYIPDTKINRKRFTAAMLEEMGVENNAEKYKMSYEKLKEDGKFEEFLAPYGESKTVVKVEQMVKLAKIKQNKETVLRGSQIGSARKRLADKELLPETGKFGEGHKIVTPSKDMSAFQDYVSER